MTRQETLTNHPASRYLDSMANKRTMDLLADKIATALELARRAEGDSQSDFTDWPDVLRTLDCLAQTVGSAIQTCVSAARQDGATWDQVGHGLSITRQAAHERFSK